MHSEFLCCSNLLLALPDDIFAIISRSLSPRDICNLSVCCRSLFELVLSEKVWLTQCDLLGIVSNQDLIDWRRGVLCYKALCRFLVSVKSLIGIWVHQNPELGNVVYVMPGFVSVVGCRIIPQELGPLGIEDGPILWAPVFEVVGDLDGTALFFLHGREKGNDFMYPGSIKPVEGNCNMLLLEVESRQQKSGAAKLVYCKSFAYDSSKDLGRNILRSQSELSRSQRTSFGPFDARVPFSRLAFGDRRKLIEVVTSQVHQKVSTNGLLFPCLRTNRENYQKDIALLDERRSSLLRVYKLGGGNIDLKAAPELPTNSTQIQLSEIRKSLDLSSGFCSSLSKDDGNSWSVAKKTIGGYFRASIKQILGKSPSLKSSWESSRSSSSSSENKHVHLQEFLRSADTIGLALRAVRVKLSSYRAWPNMHDNRYALYKLPIWVPREDQEYAGLWGGTFGWPPGKPTEDKPSKALFFLLISYEESTGQGQGQRQRQLIATKILEGTHYVLHPNGSAMFIVNIDEPSYDPFPWDTDANSNPVTVKHAFAGEGIANGYGFRYPGAKPGSLFVIQNGLLAFIWKESRAILTMQRLNLEDLLKKGERVPALPPSANFSYLTKSYSNVFVGFSNASSPRQRHL